MSDIFDDGQPHYHKELMVNVARHSNYKGWQIFRQFNIMTGRPMMSYYGVKYLEADDKIFKFCRAKNLSGIKEEISKIIKEGRD